MPDMRGRSNGVKKFKKSLHYREFGDIISEVTRVGRKPTLSYGCNNGLKDPIKMEEYQDE